MIRATVLLAARDGARFLPAQIASVLAQEGASVRLVMGDDGSTDGTRAILDAVAAGPGGHRVLDGPRRGAAAHFLHLLAETPPDEGVLAFCDQDDVWLPGKLARAAAALVGAPGPALWIGRVSVCDEGLATCVPAPLPRVAPSFGHALAEAMGSGNAMVLNAAASALLHAAARAGESEGVPHHDWWAYQMVSGAGGLVIADDLPTTLYRQHGANALGSGHGLGEVLRAPRRLLSGAYGADARAQRRALLRSAHRLAPEALAALAALERLGGLGPLRRVRALRQAGVHRAGRVGQGGLLLLAALGRL